MSQPSRPVVLCILDGWGEREERAHNAIAGGATPVWDRLVGTCPTALLETSGEAVGLPPGQMGNSEVGHMSLGAGREVLQNLPRIDRAVADGSIARLPALVDFIAKLKSGGGTAHLMGILSPGGVHGHQEHLAAVARILDEAGVPVALHAFLDGRDTPPKSAQAFLTRFLADIEGCAAVRIATVAGRYYAMDRDRRWDRTALAYDAMVMGEGERAEDALAAVARSYAADAGDEFVKPTIIAGYGGMADGDGAIVGNFRADRMRQILAALLDPDFDAFVRRRSVTFAAATGMVEYSAALNRFLATLFTPVALHNTLGEVVAAAGLRQLRIAETEKHAHVTFFFSGGEEREYPGEKRILIPSPQVATYDLKPEMSTPEVTDCLVKEIERGIFDLIVVNLANGDMVGHTGSYEAAVLAAEAIDDGLGRLEAAVVKAGGAMIVTADHGNLELMQDPATGQPHTAHTNGPVPIVLVGGSDKRVRLQNGRLADVAPTILKLLGLSQPEEMTGRSLIVRARGAAKAAAE